jgi:hypothetical protein
MDWAIGIPVLLLVLACPLMMVGMIVGGWIFGRRVMGGHGGHGMMCHGGRGSDETAASGGIVEELRAERERLDDLIAKAEKGEAR